MREQKHLLIFIFTTTVNDPAFYAVNQVVKKYKNTGDFFPDTIE